MWKNIKNHILKKNNKGEYPEQKNAQYFFYLRQNVFKKWSKVLERREELLKRSYGWYNWNKNIGKIYF